MVDDGSTDATARGRGDYAERGVRYVARPQGGAGEARNTGLAGDLGPAGRLPRRRRRLAARPGGRRRGAPRAPPRARARGRARLRLRRGAAAAAVVHAAPPPAAGDVFEELLIDNVVLNPSSVLVRRVGAGGGGRVQRASPSARTGTPGSRSPSGSRSASSTGRWPSSGATRDSISPTAGVTGSTSTARSSSVTSADFHPAWKRPLVRRGAASAAYFHAGLGSASAATGGAAGATPCAPLALDPFTLARRKATLVARAFVPESLRDGSAVPSGTTSAGRRSSTGWRRRSPHVRDLSRRAFAGFLWAAGSYAGRQGAGVRRDARARPPAGAGRVRPGGLRARRHQLPRVPDRPRARRRAGLPLRCRGPKVSSTAFWIGISGGCVLFVGSVVRGPAAGATSARTTRWCRCSACWPCSSASPRWARPTSTGCAAPWQFRALFWPQLLGG